MKESNVKLGVIIIVMVILVGCIPVAGAENTVNQTNASESYYITIDSIGNHTIGDIIYINGTTNLPTSENLSISVNDNSFNPAGQYGSFFDTTIPVQPGENGVNYWFCNITPTLSLWKTYGGRGLPTSDIKYFIAGDFIALVGSNNVTAQSNLFTISLEEENVTPTSSSIPITLSSTPIIPSTQTTEVLIPPSSTLTTPLPFELSLFVVAGFVILNVICRKKRR